MLIARWIEACTAGHPCNGDEKRYPNKISNFSKALPHNQLGEVNIQAYKKYLEALESGDPNDFEQIPLAGVVKLGDPQAAYAFELVGPDSHQLVIPAPPAFSTAEMVDLYWQALARDVPFNDYDSSPITQDAAKELSGLPVFHGPKIKGQVTTGTLFRGNYQGVLTGPYISQFLWRNIPFVSTEIIQRYRTTEPWIRPPNSSGRSRRWSSHSRNGNDAKGIL